MSLIFSRFQIYGPFSFSEDSESSYYSYFNTIEYVSRAKKAPDSRDNKTFESLFIKKVILTYIR